MGTNQRWKRVIVDKFSKEIQEFIDNLPVSQKEGCILVIHGKPLLKVVANTDIPVDSKKLVRAIRDRRDESRELLKEWEAVTSERWSRIREE